MRLSQIVEAQFRQAMSKAEEKEFDAESEKIKENSKKPAAKRRHKFKPAEWTHPNGHPRCLTCGDEEPEGGYCPR
jgi:hypothetical protein